MIRQVPPWYENIKKRQVKAPKIYIRDSGIFHTLLGIDHFKALQFHPKLGPSWEGFAIETTIRHVASDKGEVYFWSAYGRAELDLLLVSGSRRVGVEIKHTDSPKITGSLRIAQNDLQLDEIWIVYPGDEQFRLEDDVWVIGLETLIENGLTYQIQS